MKFSILIPVYNSQDTIRRCIASIVNQNAHQLEVEIIMINDGSEDASKLLLEELAQKYCFIKLFHTKNQGVYKARNLALTKVEGDYVWMLDADDYIRCDALSIIEATIKNNFVDVLNIGYTLEQEKNTFKDVETQRTDSEHMDGITFLENNDGRLYLWNNIYRREFLRQNNLKFLAKSVSLEDSLFNLTVFAKAKKVMCVNEALYTYAFQENSISRAKSLEHLIKKGTSSFNVHSQTKILRDKYQADTREYIVLQQRLAHSILGFYYSLIIEKYPIKYIGEVYVLYQKEDLLPVHKKNSSVKVWIFQKIINFKPGYLLLCKLILNISKKKKSS